MAAPAEVTRARCAEKYVNYTGRSNNGMAFKVVDYKDTSTITVEFEDGTVVVTNAHRVITNSVPHPTYTAKMYKRDCHVGEKRTSASGLEMTIIAFRTYTDIDIQFSDGAVVNNRNYGAFKKGEIKHPDGTGKGVIPSQRIGMKVKQTNGQIAEIIDYKNQLDVTIRFEDGTVVSKRRYKAFIDGQIANPNVSGYGTTRKTGRVGETNTSLDGREMTIIEYENSHHIKVKFDDGAIMSTDYPRFQEGKIRSPKWFQHKYEGMKIVPKNEIPLTITKAIDSKHLTAVFETGYELEITTNSIKDNTIKHPFPYTNGNIKIQSVSYRYSNTTNYCYCCTKCGHEDIGSIEEIHAHECLEDSICGEMLIS